MSIGFFPLPFSLGMLLLITLLKRRRNRLVYLFVLSFFWVYMMLVVALTLFPITISGAGQFHLPLRINLVPFYMDQPFYFSTLRVMEISANLLMTVPFGLLLPLLVPIRARYFWLVAIGLGLALELTQLLLALLTGNGSFRVTDINDVLLNSAGAMIGYGLFRLFLKRPTQRDNG